MSEECDFHNNLFDFLQIKSISSSDNLNLSVSISLAAIFDLNISTSENPDNFNLSLKSDKNDHKRSNCKQNLALYEDI